MAVLSMGNAVALSFAHLAVKRQCRSWPFRRFPQWYKFAVTCDVKHRPARFLMIEAARPAAQHGY
jgi:hypothetical protein